MWLQNAGFIWVPLILASTAAAWFGMDDLADLAGMAEQAVIFTRRHNWLMCWLYLGTFGSFIGFGEPSVDADQRPPRRRCDALQLAGAADYARCRATLGGWDGQIGGGARHLLGLRDGADAWRRLVAALTVNMRSSPEVSSNG